MFKIRVLINNLHFRSQIIFNPYYSHSQKQLKMDLIHGVPLYKLLSVDKLDYLVCVNGEYLQINNFMVNNSIMFWLKKN